MKPIPVHLYGKPCAMAPLLEIAEEYGIVFIEDATESLGASYRGQSTGSFGHAACFSFNGNKIITTGGGGMITTNDQKRAAHMRFLSGTFSTWKKLNRSILGAERVIISIFFKTFVQL